jgi:hypothetical protein
MELFDGDAGKSVPLWKPYGVSMYPTLTIAYLTRRGAKESDRGGREWWLLEQVR